MAAGLAGGEVDLAWKPLYRLGGIAALLGVACGIVQAAIEVVGVGILNVQVPATASDWFALLQTNRVLALTELTVFQIPAFALFVPMFIAASMAVKQAGQTRVLVASAFEFVGTAVYLASNTSVSMLFLSEQYGAATTDSQRSGLIAAGQTLLAIYQGTGIDVGLLLTTVAVLILSASMIRSRVFRTSGGLGVLTFLVALAYYVGSAFTPSAILVFEIAGLLLLIWAASVGLRLLQLGRA